MRYHSGRVNYVEPHSFVRATAAPECILAAGSERGIKVIFSASPVGSGIAVSKCVSSVAPCSKGRVMSPARIDG